MSPPTHTSSSSSPEGAPAHPAGHCVPAPQDATRSHTSSLPAGIDWGHWTWLICPHGKPCTWRRTLPTHSPTPVPTPPPCRTWSSSMLAPEFSPTACREVGSSAKLYWATSDTSDMHPQTSHTWRNVPMPVVMSSSVVGAGMHNVGTGPSPSSSKHCREAQSPIPGSQLCLGHQDNQQPQGKVGWADVRPCKHKLFITAHLGHSHQRHTQGAGMKPLVVRAGASPALCFSWPGACCP